METAISLKSNCAKSSTFLCALSVFRQKVLFQRARIDPHANGDVARLRLVGDQLQMGLFGVSGVDADLIRPRRQRRQRQTVIVMNVRHQGNGEGVSQFFEGFCRFVIGQSHAKNIASRLLQGKRLRLQLSVAGERDGAHGLNGNLSAAAHGHAAGDDLMLRCHEHYLRINKWGRTGP